MPKKGKWPFCSKLETFDTEINIEHKQIQMMRVITAHNILKGFLALLLINSEKFGLPKPFLSVLNGNVSFSSLFYQPVL